MKIISLNKFIQRFQYNLNNDSILPNCIEELCGGWSQETIKQILNILTKKKKIPLPLYFKDATQLQILSQKQVLIQGIFKIFTLHNENSYLDSYELFATLIVCSQSNSFKQKLQTLFQIICNQDGTTINQNQFQYLLEGLITGLSKVLIQKDQKQETTVYQIKQEDYQTTIEQIFDSQLEISESDFIKNTYKCLFFRQFIKSLSKKIQQVQVYKKQKQIEEIQIRIQVNKLVTDLIQQVENNVKKHEMMQMSQAKSKQSNNQQN